MALVLEFEGWIQVRLATDPDPADEPRGVSGWTFALAGEADLDRVIRLQHPVSPRSHAAPVGVTVRRVMRDGQEDPAHPLSGARVDLRGDPKFEGRNGIVSEDMEEFIDPFHLVVEGGGVSLTKRDRFVDSVTGLEYARLYLVPPDVFRRRQPVARGDSPDVPNATGIADPAAFRAARLAQVEWDLEAARQSHDSTLIAALTKRVAELRLGGPRGGLLEFRMAYAFAVDGPAAVADPEGRLGQRALADSPWPVAFWIGAWDADALQAYMRGTLTVPTVPAA